MHLGFFDDSEPHNVSSIHLDNTNHSYPPPIFLILQRIYLPETRILSKDYKGTNLTTFVIKKSLLPLTAADRCFY